MTFRELCAKEVVQLSNGACLGKADDLELDPQTAQIQSLQLLGRPRFFELPPPEPKPASFWQTLRHWLDG